MILEGLQTQTAKQVINSNVREAERERQFNDFIDKKDTILSGIVKRIEFGNVIVDLGRAEGIIQKNELIPRENIKAGDRVKAYCSDVRKEPRGQQIFLSRAHNKFMEKLFVQEVPEIYDGLSKLSHLQGILEVEQKFVLKQLIHPLIPLEPVLECEDPEYKQW